MKKIKNISEIALLIGKKITNNISDLEQNQLDKLKGDMGLDIDKYSNTNFISQFNKEKDLKESQYAYGKFMEVVKKKKEAKLRLRVVAIAASVLIPMMAYLAIPERVESIEVVVPVVTEDSFIAKEMPIEVSDNSAVLLLADGSKIEIDAENRKDIQIQKSEINIGERVIKQKSDSSDIKYHTLKTPKGGEYYIVLEDGTKVWVNADSKLEFPTQFEKERRHVKVTGEMFFEVAKDANRPFIVETNNTFIKVLGTSFNVRNYANEEQSSVTLVSGSVNINVDNQQVVLKPNDRILIGYDEISVSKVDVSLYTSWIKSQLTYKNSSLKRIMSDLERLYDIDIEFLSENTKDITFTGSFHKYDDINKILNILSITGDLKFRLEDKTIIIE